MHKVGGLHAENGTVLQTAKVTAFQRVCAGLRRSPAGLTHEGPGQGSPRRGQLLLQCVPRGERRGGGGCEGLPLWHARQRAEVPSDQLGIGAAGGAQNSGGWRRASGQWRAHAAWPAAAPSDAPGRACQVTNGGQLPRLAIYLPHAQGHRPGGQCQDLECQMAGRRLRVVPCRRPGSSSSSSSSTVVSCSRRVASCQLVSWAR